jgi:F0F1-type ATP synthase membrane subunit b/b'
MWIFSPYSDFNSKRQGRIDGSLCIPPWISEQLPDFLRSLYSTAQITLENIIRRWHRLDQSLKSAWGGAVLRQRKLTVDLAEANRQEDQAQRHYEGIHGDRMVVHEAHLRKLGYTVVIGLVLVCEFPLNAIVFQQLGGSYIETLLMTGTIAAGLVLCAHFLGEQLHKPAWGKPTAITWRIVLAVLPFFVIWAVARLRESHMERLSITHVGSRELLAMNIVINLLIFAVVAYYSYKIHEPAMEDVIKATFRRLRIARDLHKTDKAVSQCRIQREKAFEQTRRNAATITAEVRRRAALYRRDHLRKRTDRDQQGNSAVPIWFNVEPELTIGDLQKLDWSLDPTLETHVGEPVLTQRIRFETDPKEVLR